MDHPRGRGLGRLRSLAERAIIVVWGGSDQPGLRAPATLIRTRCPRDESSLAVGVVPARPPQLAPVAGSSDSWLRASASLLLVPRALLA